MKKSLYLVALAALAFTSCSSDEKDIFDKSAAERLEEYKAEYTATLTKDGGLWEVEYFSNEEEPGYVFVMKFNSDKSVEMTANHKWIGDVVKKETSLWTMIADNGPVLSFNSYNELFHIFSDPKNITGENAPSTEDGTSKVDIDETGYGHDGDYEFQVMSVSEDGNTIRLMGKKRLYYMYMRRLDSNTDVDAYMNDLKSIETSLFSKKINTLLYTDANGEKFVVKDAYKGVLSIYPLDGDPIDQTASGNFIITHSGIRFMQPLYFQRADGTECVLEEMNFANNFSLVNVADNKGVLNAGTFSQFMMNNQASWSFSPKDFTGSVKDCFNEFESELKTLYNYKSAGVKDFQFIYDSTLRSYIVSIYIRFGTKDYETDKFVVSFDDVDGAVKISLVGSYDDNSQLALNAYTKLGELLNILTGEKISYSSNSDSAPLSVVLTTSNGDFVINVL